MIMMMMMMMIVNIARYLPHLCSILVEFDASSHHISTNVHAIVFISTSENKMSLSTIHHNQQLLGGGGGGGGGII